MAARGVTRQNVYVEVEDVLAGIPAMVPADVHRHGPKRIGHLAHQRLHGEKQAAYRVVAKLGQRRGVSGRDNDHVTPHDWIFVQECDRGRAFKHYLAFKLALGDLAKDAVAHSASSVLFCVRVPNVFQTVSLSKDWKSFPSGY